MQLFEPQYKTRISEKLEPMLSVPSDWLSAPKVISAIWPEIVAFTNSGATYRRALEILNKSLGDRFSINTLQVVCSNHKRRAKA